MDWCTARKTKNDDLELNSERSQQNLDIGGGRGVENSERKKEGWVTEGFHLSRPGKPSDGRASCLNLICLWGSLKKLCPQIIQ